MKKIFFIVIYFALVITSMLSLFASNEYVHTGEGNEIVNHIENVFQAKVALDEGQFPPRTSPLLHHNYGNAYFQFYSPAFYTIAGLCTKYFFQNNPYLALKCVLWFCLLLGAVFFQRFIFLLTHSNINAILAATAYILHPYLMVCIFGLGHIPESAAAGFIPIILYYSSKIFLGKNGTIVSMIYASLAWYFLLATHVVTFFYFSFLCVLFFTILLFFYKLKTFKNLIYIGIAYLYSLLLGAYYIVPVGLYEKIVKMGSDHHFLGYKSATFLTPLSSLISLKPVSPMPLPGDYWIAKEQKLFMSLGFLTLLMVGGFIYACLFYRKIFNQKSAAFGCAALVIFFIALLAVWSPFYFWHYVPEIFQIGQFTYRLLIQTMWSGALVFAITLYIFKKDLRISHLMIGILLISLCSRQWITRETLTPSVSAESFAQKVDSPHPNDSYFVVPERVNAFNSPQMLSVEQTQPYCVHKGKKTYCDISLAFDVNNIVQLPIFYYPDMLNIKVNGQKIEYIPTKSSSFTFVGLRLPKGSYKIESYFQGVEWANWISIFAWFVLIVSLLLYSIRCKQFKF